MEIQLLLLHISLLTSSLWSLSCSTAIASPPSLAKPNCQSYCGDIEIPYPFGIGPGCYRNKLTQFDRGFQILCDNSTNPPKPSLNLSNGIQPEVLEISLAGTLKINSPITFLDCPNKPNYSQTPYLPNLASTPFYISMKNKFTSVSCGMIAALTFPESDEETMAVCLSVCDYIGNTGIIVNSSCGGINCCQTSLRFATDRALNISFAQLPVNGDSSEPAGRQCKYAFLVDQEWFTSSSTDSSAIADMDYVPIVLDWLTYPAIDNSTEDNVNRNCESECGPCSCSKGYQGNPYFRWRM